MRETRCKAFINVINWSQRMDGCSVPGVVGERFYGSIQRQSQELDGVLQALRKESIVNIDECLCQ